MDLAKLSISELQKLLKASKKDEQIASKFTAKIEDEITKRSDPKEPKNKVVIKTESVGKKPRGIH